jgi:hypothetical protein
MTYEHSARSTARADAQRPKQMSTKAVFLRLSVSCCVLGTLSLPTQAYNSRSSNAPDVRFGHPWITNQAMEYLKRIDPFAYVFVKKYREQLIYGAWLPTMMAVNVQSMPSSCGFSAAEARGRAIRPITTTHVSVKQRKRSPFLTRG